MGSICLVPGPRHIDILTPRGLPAPPRRVLCHGIPRKKSEWVAFPSPGGLQAGIRSLWAGRHQVSGSVL